MSKLIVGQFDSSETVEAAIEKLEQRGFDIKTLSVVEQDYRYEKQVKGRFNPWSKIVFWSAWGYLLGFLVGLIVGPAAHGTTGTVGFWFTGALANGFFVAATVAIVYGIFLLIGGARQKYDYLISGYPATCLLLVEGTDIEVERVRSALGIEGISVVEPRRAA